VIVPQTAKCDLAGCGRERTATNHWFAVSVKSGAIVIRSWETAEELGVLSESAHFCGQTHALQFVSAEIGKKETA
jgi:hypothetical protein